MMIEQLAEIKVLPWTAYPVGVGVTGIGISSVAKQSAETVIFGISLSDWALWATIAVCAVGVIVHIYKLILMRRYEKRAEAVAEVMDEAERTQREAIARNAVESSWGKPPDKWFRK